MEKYQKLKEEELLLSGKKTWFDRLGGGVNDGWI